MPGCLPMMPRLFLLTLVTFCYFLYLFLLVVNLNSYFLLGLGVRNVIFLLVVTIYKLFFIGPGGEGFYSSRDGGS
jgi:hypothetical protein